EYSLDAFDTGGHQRDVGLGRYGTALAGSLHFDDLACCGRHDVQVGFGARVFGEVEVEQDGATTDTDTDGTDLVSQRPLRQVAPIDQTVRSLVERGVTRNDAGAARAAVGEEHVDVDGDGLAREQVEVDRAS